MHKIRRWILLLAVLVLALMLAGSVLAMGSDNYRLDWFVVLTGAGGGAASSDNYGVNLTVGQSAISLSSSDGYGACLGYWCGIATEYSTTGHAVYLPVVLKQHGP
jgi:hypothetical protein